MGWADLKITPSLKVLVKNMKSLHDKNSAHSVLGKISTPLFF